MPTDSRIEIDPNAFGEPFTGVVLIVGSFDPLPLPGAFEQVETGSGAFIGNRTVLTGQHVTENLEDARVVVGAGTLAIPGVLGSFLDPENGSFRDILGTDDIGIITIENPNIVAAVGPEPALVFGMEVFVDPQNYIDNLGSIPVVHGGFPGEGFTGNVNNFTNETVIAQMFGVSGEIDEIRDFGSARLASDTNFTVGPDSNGNGTFDVAFEVGADGALDASRGQSGGPLLVFDEASGQWRTMGIASQAVPNVSTVFELIKPDSFQRISDIMSSLGDSLPDGVSNRITGIIGNTVRERIEGSRFDDIIRSMGAADGVEDLLFGGAGNDTYEFSLRYGDAAISEAIGVGGQDSLFFPELRVSDIRLSRAGDQNLYVNFSDPVTGADRVVTINNHFAGRPVEEIRLSDGVIPLTAGLALVGTEAGDNFGGTAFDDTLSGLGGNDVLSGFGGNDTLVFGAGRDILNGGEGSDLYVLPPGFAGTIVDPEGVSDVVFLDRLSLDNVRLIRPDVTGLAGGSLAIYERSSGFLTDENSVTINGQFLPGAGIEKLVFANGQELDLTNGLPFTGSEDRNNLRGTEFDDRFFAGGNRDFVDAGDGNDWIVGGTGNDVLAGGSGDDTYVFSPGDGQDGINEAADGGTDDTILLQGFNSALLEIEDFGSLIVFQLGSDEIRISKGIGAPNPVESLIFADGGGIDLTAPGALQNAIPVGGTDTLGEINANETFDISVNELLSNDTDLDPDTSLAVVGVEQGTGGTVSIEGERLAFVPAMAFAGTATFAYLLSDGIATVPVEVQVEVSPALATEGDDSIFGTIGADTLDAQGGNDFVTLLAGNDSILGGSGNDTLNGGAGADVMDGGPGNDRFFVDDARDVVIEAAGEGTDLVSTSVDFVLPDSVENGSTLGTGDVAITGNALANFITGNGGANHLRGEGGGDRLIAGLGGDTLAGGAGNDILQGQGGADRFVMTADNGDDQILDWEASTDVLDFSDLGLRFVDLAITSSGNEALITFDDPAGGTGSVRLVDIDPKVLEIGIMADPGGVGAPGGIPLTAGTSGADNLAATNDADDMVGLAGNDILNGRAGADTMAGGFGNDRYFLDQAGDRVIELEFQGADQMDAGFSFTLAEHVENGGVLGGGDVDITGNGLANFITGSAGSNVLRGEDGRDRLIGFGGDDTLIGGQDNDVLEGGTGADLFVFEADSALNLITDFEVGVDLIDITALGLAFADLTIVDGPLGALVIFDAAPGSIDLVQLQDVAAADLRLASFVTVFGENQPPIVGTQGNDVLFGSIEADELQALGGNDLLNGLGGADLMVGGPGDDRYFVDDAGDVVVELANEGTDLVSSFVDVVLSDNVENGSALDTGEVDLTGNALNNALTGNAGSNMLSGEAGADNLQGLAGADIIDGGSGADVLRGGADADTFVFEIGDGSDQIIDFVIDVDTIDLSATGLGFADLTITDTGPNATITYSGNTITVFNTTAAQLDQDQFEFGV